MYFAPPGYNNEPSAVRYFALVITNQNFSASKIPNLPDNVEADHKSLSDIVSHPYKCKFREDDCIFLKDASLAALTNSMDSIEGKIKGAIDEIRERMSKPGELSLAGSRKSAKVRPPLRHRPPNPPTLLTNPRFRALLQSSASKKPDEDEEDAADTGDKDSDDDDDKSVGSNISALSKGSAFSGVSGVSKLSSKKEIDDDKSVNSKGSKGSKSTAKTAKSKRSQRSSVRSDPSISQMNIRSSVLHIGQTDHDPTVEEYDHKKDIAIQRQQLGKFLMSQPPEAQVALVVYLCTHAITLKKTGTGDGMYFLTTDSSWTSTKKLRKSSISLPKFCDWLKRIGEKSRLLPCARSPPKPSIVSRRRVQAQDNLSRRGALCKTQGHPLQDSHHVPAT